MALTDYSSRTTRTRPNGTKETTSTGNGYTTKVSHDKSGKLVKGVVYRGDLRGKHSHCEPTSGYSRDVKRSDVFDGKK